jgi:hypothetical protein
MKKKILIFCNKSYYAWVISLIKKSNFYFVIYCDDEVTFKLIKKEKLDNVKIYSLKKFNAKFNLRSTISRIEKSTSKSLFYYKKPYYAYYEEFAFNDFIKNEVNTNDYDNYVVKFFLLIEKIFKENKINLVFLEHLGSEMSGFIEYFSKKNNIECFLLYETFFKNKFFFINSRNFLAYSNNKINTEIKNKLINKYNFFKNKRIFSPNEYNYHFIKKDEMNNNLLKLLYNFFLNNDKIKILKLHEKIIFKIKRIIRLIYLKKVSRNNIKNKYVVFYLSFQPEFSTYYLSEYGTNQFELIKKIREFLPSGIDLVVKEHPHQIRTKLRDVNFYKRVNCLKNTYLINSYYNSYKLLKNSLFIFSVSGTIAIEALIFNKITVIFSKMFYRKFKNINYIDSNSKLEKTINNTLKIKKSKNYLNDFIKLNRLSYKGSLLFSGKNAELTKYTVQSIENFINYRLK